MSDQPQTTPLDPTRITAGLSVPMARALLEIDTSARPYHSRGTAGHASTRALANRDLIERQTGDGWQTNDLGRAVCAALAGKERADA